MPYPRSFFRFFEIKICKNKKYSYLCTPNRWVRITVSTRDSQSRNRSSILLPSTKSAAFKRGSAFFDIIDILATGATRNRGSPGAEAQVPGVNGAGSRTGGAGSGCQRCRFTDGRRKFRVSTAQVHEQAAQVTGVNGAGSKTGAEPAPRIGLLRCSGGTGFGPKMEPAPLTAEPAPFTTEPAPPIPEPAPSGC